MSNEKPRTRLTPQELQNLADAAQKEEWCTFDADPASLYCLFKALVDNRKGRASWQALRSAKHNVDRDALVLSSWQHLEAQHGEVIKKEYHSLEYHRHFLFDWFLDRYDVRRARQAVGGGKVASNVHLLLALAVLALFLLRRSGLFEPRPTVWSVVLSVVIYSVAVASLAVPFRERLSKDSSEALILALHSLVPRLAGAGAVGLVILASSQELLRVVVATKPWWLIGLFLAGYCYLLLEMARRIHPLPRRRRLALLAFDISMIALSHSAALAMIAEGGLRRVLANTEAGESFRLFTLGESANVVFFVFTIGLVVNLIWAEQPVTEPL